MNQSIISVTLACSLIWLTPSPSPIIIIAKQLIHQETFHLWLIGKIAVKVGAGIDVLLHGRTLTTTVTKVESPAFYGFSMPISQPSPPD
ncbi:MAG: hypothetical protein KJ069_17115 [Anaerolineae bacterium]|nr:hypothetical protein [Anaerolineae bacterium]